MFAIFLFSICWRTAENTRQKQIVIYHHSKHFIIDFINGKNNFIFCDSTLINNKSTLNFTCKNYWTKQGLSNAHFYSLQSTNFNNPVLIKYQNHFQFFNTTISYINYDWRKQSSEKTTNTDILVIDRGSIGQIQKLTHYLNPKIIIFLASCHIKRVKEWKNECHNLNIPYIDIKDHGAFIKEL